jgi:hypothetical protein
MAIFNSYVKLPEGKSPCSLSKSLIVVAAVRWQILSLELRRSGLAPVKLGSAWCVSRGEALLFGKLT